MFTCRRAAWTGGLGLCAALCAGPAGGAPMVFTVDAGRSQLVLSGSVGSSNFLAQASGALTAACSGTLNVELAGGNLQFTGGSLVAVQTNGVWQPAPGGLAGAAPADFGGTNSANVGTGYGSFVPGNLALRTVSFDWTSPALALTNGGFDGTSVTCILSTNAASLDFYYASDAVTNQGSTVINGAVLNAAAGASLVTNSGVRELTLPVSVQFPASSVVHNDSLLIFTGRLVAWNGQPVIQSIVKQGDQVALTTEYTTAQSMVEVSTNLAAWSAAAATVSTNGSGLIVFTVAPATPQAFYRVIQ